MINQDLFKKRKIKNLQQDEFEELLQPSKRKFKLNLLSLLIGILFVISGFVVFLLEIVLFVPSIFTLIGLYLIGRFTRTSDGFRRNSPYNIFNWEDRETFGARSYDLNNPNYFKTRSFASSRLIGALIPLLLAIYNMYKFTLNFGQNLVGTWFVLNGFSLFYPLSLYPMIVSIGLIISTFFTSRIISIAKTKNLIIFKEFRIFGAFRTEVPKKAIKAISISNSKVGPRYLWIFVLGVHSIFCLDYAWHFLTNPFAFGYAYYVGGAYLLSGLIQMGVLILLVLKTQTILEIVTNKRRYALHLSLPAATPTIRHSLERFFSFDNLSLNSENNNNNNHSKNNTKIRNLNPESEIIYKSNHGQIISLIYGLLMIILGATLEYFEFMHSEILDFFLYLTGLILIAKYIKDEALSKKNGTVLSLKRSYINSNPNNTPNNEPRTEDAENNSSNSLQSEDKVGIFEFNKSFSWMHDLISIKNVERNDIQIKPGLPSINIFIGFSFLMITFLMALSVGSHFKYVPPTSFVYPIGIAYLFLSAVILLLLIFYLIRPTLKCNIKSDDIEHTIELSNSFKETINYCKTQSSHVERANKKESALLKQLKGFYSICFKDEKKTTQIRLITLLLCYLIGFILPFIIV